MTSAHALCDAGFAASGKPRAVASKGRGVLVVSILASGLAYVDGSVVNVGLPAIARGLGASQQTLQWVVNGYLLPLAALLLLGGAAGDLYGKRRVLIAGVALFGLASVACALAPNAAALVAARFAQGAGAALLLPNSLSILGSAFEGEAKGRAIGYWAASGAILGAVGPVLGGWFIDLGSWRAIFLINAPIAAAAIALAIQVVPVDPKGDGAPLDGLGAGLATAALGLLTWAVTVGAGPAGWTLGALAALAGAVVAAAAFLVVERRRGDRAITPTALFGSPTYVGLTVFTILLYGALSVFLLLTPYLLIRAAGYGATAAGAAILPFPLIMAALSPFVGALAGRVGSTRLLGWGSVVVAAGCALMLRIGDGAGYWTQVAPGVLVMALGMSAAAAPLTTAVLSSVDARHTGVASGVNSAAARAGGLVGTALLGRVLAAQGPTLLADFRIAMLASAGACLAAGATMVGLVGRARKKLG
jgi:EmrB/QacA subfamily drug resistance transporter